MALAAWFNGIYILHFGLNEQRYQSSMKEARKMCYFDGSEQQT